MIDIKELRIGNIVSVSGLKGIVVGIPNFQDNDVLIRFSGKEELPFSLKSVEPVQLTDEILTKISRTQSIDFYSKEKYYNFECGGEESFCVTPTSTYGAYLIIYNNSQIERSQPPAIRYLHQLQNHYFDLTGREVKGEL